MRGALTLAGCLLLAGAASAEDAAPVSGEFVRLFSSYCLQGFPDNAAINGQVARDRLEPLDTGRARALLRGRPGAGWRIVGADGEYAVTVQDQKPLRACAIHRQSEKVLDGAPLAAAARAFVKMEGHDLLAPVSSSLPTADGGISDALVLQEVDAKGVSINSAYMFITVRHPGGLGADGSFVKPSYDLRFVRQLFRNDV